MTIHHSFNFDKVDPSWQACLHAALEKMDPEYIASLAEDPNWLPGPDKIFSAFSMPVSKVNYVLFGESPYPRAQSANGYAFWDSAVEELWSTTGLSKPVNRATSLRNIMKMLLVSEGILDHNRTGQHDIANVNKSSLIENNNELFGNFLKHGFLLLNATLVLQPKQVRKDAIAWHPFVKHILEFLFKEHPRVQIILLGGIANTIDKLIAHFDIKRLYAEHPYNYTFINNQKVLDFFRPFHLLNKST